VFRKSYVASFQGRVAGRLYPLEGLVYRTYFVSVKALNMVYLVIYRYCSFSV